MSLASVPFFVFFACVFAVYVALGHRWQNRWLLVANLFFFASWGWGSLAAVAALTLASFLLAKGATGARREAWLAAAWLLTLAALIYFRATRPQDVLQVVFPIGLSFYSLQLLAYVIEVARGGQPARNPAELFLFSSFFPTATMGPIERYSHLRGQFENPREVNAAKIAEGAYLVAFGLFRKLVIANRLLLVGRELQMSEARFGLLDGALFLGFAFFLLYSDFAGYTDIARGVARILGFDLVENFRQPYLARNLGQFLVRWHCSLIGWARDFIYWPVALRTRRLGIATFLTFCFLSLWHGISWSCWVVGIYLAVIYFGYSLRRRFFPGWLRKASIPAHFFSSVSVVLLVSGSFLLSRATPAELSAWFEPTLLSASSPLRRLDLAWDLWLAAAAVAAMIALESLKTRSIRYCIAGSLGLLFFAVAFGISSSPYFVYMRY